MGRREKSREQRKSKTALSLSLHSCGYSDHPNSHLPSANLPFGLVAFYTSHILLESQGEGGFSNSIFTNGRHSLLQPGKRKLLPHMEIILQSFNSLTRVKRQRLPMQLALQPHLQRLGKETHSQESFTIPPSLPTMQVQQPELFPLHGCHPASYQPQAHTPPDEIPVDSRRDTACVWQVAVQIKAHPCLCLKGKKCCCLLMIATFISQATGKIL